MNVEEYRLNILIVDDRNENLIALESLLKEEPADVFKAHSGRDALELLLKHEFALMIFDVQMPEMNGFELAELTRLKDRTKAIPIIFVTAGAIDPKHTFMGYEAGAVDFLYKPLDSRIVKSKVRVFLELARQRQMIQEQMDQLSAALQARDDFISIASHELKTPITSMQLQQQMVLRSIAETSDGKIGIEKISKTFQNSVKQLKKLSQIIDELLDISRIRSGKFHLEIEDMDLSKLVKETVANFQDQLENAKCVLTLKVQEGVFARGDSFRTEQVVNNLITNVIKYAPGPVEIALKVKDGRASMSIQDHGVGIPPEKISTVFDRFERIENEKAISGLGLGLYIVKQIMDAQGGMIEVKSQLNVGTTFTAHFQLKE